MPSCDAGPPEAARCKASEPHSSDQGKQGCAEAGGRGCGGGQGHSEEEAPGPGPGVGECVQPGCAEAGQAGGGCQGALCLPEPPQPSTGLDGQSTNIRGHC